MTSPSRIITLTTDFGTADGFVGAIKGRLLQLAPAAQLVDISHDIAPQDIVQGAWCLWQAVGEYPPGTVHLAVVDPGVGSQRAGLVMQTEHYLLVGPDNGLLSLAARRDGLRRVVRIGAGADAWARSSTFDGLTLFAPVAAQVANGTPLDGIGTETKPFVTLPLRDAEVSGDTIQGEVQRFDRFGNGITNIHRSMAGHADVAAVHTDPGMAIPFCHSYGDMAGLLDQVGALWNSEGFLELAVFSGDSRRGLGLKIGTRVRMTLRRR